MSHQHTYFSEIHATKASQFFGESCDVPDTDEIAELRTRLAAAPKDFDLLTQLAAKLSFQLRYREALALYERAVALRPDDVEARRGRAARLLATLQTRRAYEEYTACRNLKPEAVDIANRVGISAYILGKDAEAAEVLAWCVAQSADEPETQVAVSYWLALTELRMGGGTGAWRHFDFAAAIDHHTGYRAGLAVLCGRESAEETYGTVKQSEDSLNGCIVLYALAIWYKQQGDSTRYRALLREILAWDDFWPGFAYLVAWSEWESLTVKN